MRLYQNSLGQWAGTQAEARRKFPRDWREVEVPVSKQPLIEWLNIHEVGAKANGLASIPTASSAIPEPELLTPDAASWVAWALDCLKRGDRSEAEEMLIKGIAINNENRRSRA